ncbi:Protein CBR-CRN-4 [Caenorhabditis briggsae]|uniref:Exonuclease domain-containing protein n=2 Tax=Caenorhabditis briggsae TaxID=6238 RepID=A0AAE8ZP10_CAEBR|nr:Protein CBR-CRN-4 [Caenorhabditis briggsae]ULT81566.1 hypothetical protein L3Y34_011504 [Caenorhabditis briggsae]CAP32715.1 Protein CBR-CRN-4 [Caenorhabditis briggsae]
MPPYNCPFDHLLILDFETTSGGKNRDYPTEIIQFSVVPLDVKAKTMLEGIAFNKFVRPVINPTLSEHCAELTGIKQESLNSADTFLVVYKQFLEWLQKNGFQERHFAIVSDSRQDMWRIAQYQFRLVRETMPSMFRQWINIKRTFDDGLEDGQKEKLVGTTNIEKMSNYLGIELSGKAHDALSDCLNIAAITHKILEIGCPVTINEMLCCSAIWRKKPIDMTLHANWKMDFLLAHNIFHLVLPLTIKVVRNYTANMYGVCPYCKKPPTVCGAVHKQPPREFYASLTEPCVFAKAAGFY